MAYVLPDHSENFGEQARRLLNERASASASTNNTRMAVVENRPAEAEPPPQTKTFVDAAFYINLKATIEVIFVLGWGVFILQYQSNELDDPIFKVEKI